jgi:threonine dehydratase
MTTTRSLERVPIEDVRAAQERIADVTLRAPLVRLNLDDLESRGNEVYLKLENLQPSGAFKLRGAVNAIRLADEAQLERGVWTASSGNMALAVAWAARYFGLKCVCVVADVSPDAKLDAIRDLGAGIVEVPWLEVLEICRVHRRDGMDGLFLHPFSDPKVMAGNATVGLEIVEDLPDVDAVLVPYGGGGFAVSVASAVKALRPEARVYAAEVEAGPAFAASLAAGKPTEIDHPTSFVSGIGSPVVFEDVWPLAREILDGSVVSTLEEAANAVRLVAQRARVVAEGAGASSVAGALSGGAGDGKIACVLSGGNIDAEKLAEILRGGVPGH